MKTKTHNKLIIIVFILLITALFIVFIIMMEETFDTREEICKKIESKTDLKYLDWSDYPCGEGIVCSYTCRFVNNNGDIISKHIG